MEVSKELQPWFDLRNLASVEIEKHRDALLADEDRSLGGAYLVQLSQWCSVYLVAEKILDI